MGGLTFAPAMDVTHACVRRRFRHSSCCACADVCPVQAFSFTDSGVSVDDSRCIDCGDCLFVCPAGAITGITPRKRFLSGDTLAGPFTDRAPGVNELLLWHAQYHVRFISIDAEQNPDWLLAIARLNLALRRRGEAAWAFKHIPVNEVNTARRALMHVPREDVRVCSVVAGQRELRRAFSAFSEAEITLDTESCVLCGACWRSCTENAIRFENAELVVETGRCTGCGGCEAVCQHAAINVTQTEGTAKRVTIPAYEAVCLTCHRHFWSFTSDEKQCPLCFHHQRGMRNTSCC
ncbi:4Fe-4S binding protein [Enterobacter hormaechei]|nr:4Fe-4S binding protein [Enterobacter hormaechei]ELC7295548.1 4Fe-4S binding protein [Enterobacter hormaechei]